MPHDDQKLAEADMALKKTCPKSGSQWRHLTTGNVYVVLLGAVEESTLTPVVVYRPRAIRSPTATIWTRPLSEFLEKFEAVTDGAPEPAVAKRTA